MSGPVARVADATAGYSSSPQLRDDHGGIVTKLQYDRDLAVARQETTREAEQEAKSRLSVLERSHAIALAALDARVQLRETDFLTQLKQQNESHEARINKMLADYEGRISAQSLEHTANMARLQNQVTQVSSLAEDRLRSVERLQGEVTGLQATVKQLNEGNEQIRNNLAADRVARAALEVHVTKLNDELAAQKKEKEALSKQVNHLRTQQAQTEGALQKEIDANSALNRSLEGCRKTISALEAVLEGSRKHGDDLASRVRVLSSTNERLNRDLETQVNLRVELERRIHDNTAAHRATVLTLEARFVQATTDADNQRQANRTANARIAQLENQGEVNSARITQVESQLSATNTQCTTLTAQLGTINQLSQTLGQQLAQEQYQGACNVSEMGRLKHELNLANQRLSHSGVNWL